MNEIKRKRKLVFPLTEEEVEKRVGLIAIRINLILLLFLVAGVFFSLIFILSSPLWCKIGFSLILVMSLVLFFREPIVGTYDRVKSGWTE